MNINKLIKKDKKKQKIFIIIMIIIALLCPLTLTITGIQNIFLIIYLFVLEFLICISILYNLNNYRLEYEVINNKLRLKLGILSNFIVILCDKVVLVHTQGRGENIEIIIVCNVSLKSTYLKPVTRAFLKKYSGMKTEVEKIRGNDFNTILYYISIKSGSLKKYELLDTIYKNCVKAKYTDNAIENIQIARGQKKLKF